MCLAKEIGVARMAGARGQWLRYSPFLWARSGTPSLASDG